MSPLLADLSIEERYDLVTEVVHWTVERHPVAGLSPKQEPRLELFDKAWAVVRQERRHRRPEECVILRTVVNQFLPELLELKHEVD